MPNDKFPESVNFTIPSSENPEEVIRLLEKYDRGNNEAAVLQALERDEAVAKILDHLRSSPYELKEQFFFMVHNAPVELRLRVATYWLYGEIGMLQEAQNKPDEYYSQNIEERRIDLEDFAPYDYLSSGTPKQTKRIPLSHQLNADHLVGVAFRGGLKACDVDLEPTSRSVTFTHPLVSRWVDSKGKEVNDLRNVPFLIEERVEPETITSRFSIAEYLSNNYPQIFAELQRGVAKLASEFPEFYLCVTSSDSSVSNFRYAFKYHPELKQTEKTKKAYLRAKDLVQRIMDLLKLHDSQFQGDTDFHILIQDETSRPEIGISPALKLEAVLNSMLQATRPAPTFYRPDFSLLIDQSAETLDKDKLEENKFSSSDFWVDDHGSFLFDSSDKEKPDISSQRIKGIILHTDFLEADEAEKILERLLLTLRVAYLRKPEDVLPIYNSKGEMLWPKSSS